MVRIGEPEPACPDCGRVVLAGPPCCAGAKARLDAWVQSDEYRTKAARERADAVRAKREQQAAKRMRRAARLAAKETTR